MLSIASLGNPSQGNCSWLKSGDVVELGADFYSVLCGEEKQRGHCCANGLLLLGGKKWQMNFYYIFQIWYLRIFSLFL